jgi:hypothetical protein
MKRSFGAWAVVAGLASAAAHAEIVEWRVISMKPYGQFATGKYLQMEAEVRGELDPAEPIPGLEKAARNAAGRVEYRTPVTLILPESRKGNGALLVDVPNRGRPISHALYNSPRDRPIAVGSLDQGLGLLENRGYSIAVVQWELGEGPALPSFDAAGGRKLYAEGVGFAAVRDVAIFLRHGAAPGNPLAGGIERAYAVGYSQTARFMKSFLVNGFNEDHGRMVFDGVHIVNAAAGGMPLLDAGPGPGSVAWDTPGHPNPDLRGVHEEPFTWADAMREAAKHSKALPKVIVNNTYNDYLGGRASLARTGAHGTAFAAIPDNVRVFDISGAPHTNSRERNAACGEGQGQLDWSPALRAELVMLDNWVRDRAAPPESRLFDLEARPGDPEAFAAPKYLADAVVLVPKRGADGNAHSGVELPDIAVPIASHGFMNGPLTTMACRQAGTYRPFAKTAAERAAGDMRPALDELYPGGINEYVTKVRLAAGALVSQRLLMPEDALIILHSAAQNSAFAPTKPRARGATAAPAAR